MCPVAKTVLPLQGMQVQFLVREAPRAIRWQKKKQKNHNGTPDREQPTRCLHSLG